MHHSHGSAYRIGKLLTFLGVEGAAACGKARIDVAPGEISRVRRAAELSLAQRGGLYQMGGSIVAIQTDPFTGDVSTKFLDEPGLAAMLSDDADWYRYDVRTKKSICIDPMPRPVQTLLKAGQYQYLPVLKGLACQPFMRDDGSLVTEPGYDAASGQFAVFNGGDFNLPEPTEEAVRAGLEEYANC